MSKANEILGLLCATALAVPMAAQAADAVTDALKGGKVSGDIRVRYETVSDDAVAKDADALTIRTRLGYETAPYQGFTLVGEFEDVRPMFGMDDYAPETTQVPAYATILDRSVTELNRAYLRYRGVPKLDLGYGRQRINYDNQRFIGAVGWRQDDQTFDGFTAAYTGLPNFAFNYAYLTGVNGIDQAFDSSKINDHLINISYDGFTWGKFTGYGYLLDHEDETNAAVNAGLRFNTNDTYGLRFDGGYLLPITKSVKLLYAAEYAIQDFETTAGVERDVDYKFAEVGVVYGLPKVGLTAKFSYEELGSDDGLYGFQTPYGTKHAFNGWADKFLVTPVAGLEDKFVTVAANLLPYKINLMAVYHTYQAAEGSGDFGSEWNVQATKAIGSNYTVGIKYAAYTGEDLPYRDTDKLWVWGEFKF